MQKGSDPNIPSNYKPVAYTVSVFTVDKHLSAIDKVLLTLQTNISSVLNKVLTGFVSGAGIVSVTDTILTAINKINGNQILDVTAITALTPTAPTTVVSATANLTSIVKEQTIEYTTTATNTTTLPAASIANSGNKIRIINKAAFAINSATSNIIPLASSTPGTAIIAATAGKFAILQSDGTAYWHIIDAN